MGAAIYACSFSHLSFGAYLKERLQVFPIPGLKRGFFKLMVRMNNFRASSIAYALRNSYRAAKFADGKAIVV